MIWLSVSEVAHIMACSERTIRRRAKSGELGTSSIRYVKGSKGQGGKRLEILLESLPSESQVAYLNINNLERNSINNHESYTLTQREKGELRSLAVTQYKKYRSDQIKYNNSKETAIIRNFVEKWNLEHPDFTCTVKTLYSWRNKSKSGNPQKLVDRRGGHNKGQSSIPDEMLDFFKTLYLRESKPSIANCYRQTLLEANNRGIIIPGLRAFELAANSISSPILALHREGGKYFSDNYMPYTEREYTELYPNDRWVSDHHLWDVFVRIPDGKGGWIAKRPWGTYWQDMRTRKMISSIVRIEDPNSDVVLCSFGYGVEKFGIPKSVLLDNGRDYKANDLFNNECKDVIDSLAKNLQLDTVYAIPYNAKAKPIERTFGTFEDQFGKLHNTYAGCNAKARPESLKELDILDYPTLEEFVETHDKYVYEVYNNTVHNGSYMNKKTPNQMYTSLPFNVRKVSKDVLYFSLMRVKGKRVVQRNGVTFNGVHYYHDSVINFIGKKVFAKYSPNRPDILYIFDENENYLFTASKIEKLGFSPSVADYERENMRRKTAKYNAFNGYKPDKSIGYIDYVRTSIEQQSTTFTELNELSTVTEMIRNPKLEETVKRVNMSEAERFYQDTINKKEATKQACDDKKRRNAEAFKQSLFEDHPQHRAVVHD